jgi:predicted nucleotidyltransferase
MTTKINYVELTKQIVLQHILANQFKVFLFGSRVCGNAKKFSDIDVGILGNCKFSTLLRFQIEEDIDESLVPFKVDIVDFFNVDEKFKKEALKQIVEWN